MVDLSRPGASHRLSTVTKPWHICNSVLMSIVFSGWADNASDGGGLVMVLNALHCTSFANFILIPV